MKEFEKDCVVCRRENSRGFMCALRIRGVLAESGADDLPAREFVAAGDLVKVHPFHPFVEEGQVRLLSQTDELAYVLVLGERGCGAHMIVPFSAYSQPATELELRLHVDGGLGLRVVQVWNARQLQDSVLRKSWLVGRLPMEEVADVRALWTHSVGGETPSEDVLLRTGVPIGRLEDPRVAYLDKEKARFAKLDREDFEVCNRVAEESGRREPPDRVSWRRPNPFAAREMFVREHRLAAADSREPISSTRKLEGLDGSLLIRYAPDEATLNIRVFDGAGEKSTVLDGWAVLGADAAVLGYFDGAVFEAGVGSEFDGGIRFLDLDGNPHDLTEEA